MIQLRCGHGTIAVQSRYCGSVVKVRSWYSCSTIEVWSRFGHGMVTVRTCSWYAHGVLYQFAHDMECSWVVHACYSYACLEPGTCTIRFNLSGQACVSCNTNLFLFASLLYLAMAESPQQGSSTGDADQRTEQMPSPPNTPRG